MINKFSHIGATTPPRLTEKTGGAKDIVGGFQEMFDSVNQDQLNAENKISELVAGKNKDIPATMIAMEKAEVSMKMLLAVRGKVVSAYEEMMRMQI